VQFTTNVEPAAFAAQAGPSMPHDYFHED
jgi:hypothetical protein